MILLLFIYALTLEIQRSDIYPNISKIYMPDGLYKLPVGYNSSTMKLLSFIVPILLMNRLRHSLSKVTYLGFENKQPSCPVYTLTTILCKLNKTPRNKLTLKNEKVHIHQQYITENLIEISHLQMKIMNIQESI